MEGFQFDMAAARIKATHLRPYFSVALCSLRFTERPGLGTVAVTPAYWVLCDYDAFKKWDVGGQATALVHEVSHILLDHHKRAIAHGVPRTNGHQRLWNWAGDCEINAGMMRDTTLKWPIEPLHPSQFDLPDDKTAEWYYDELVKRAQEGGDSGGGEGQQGEGNEADDGKVMQGGCGTCAHHGQSTGDAEAHDLPDDGLSEFEREMIKQRVAHEIKRASQRAGNVPAGWQRWADHVLHPKINYWVHLRNLVRGTVMMVPGLGYRTFARPRRRPPFDPDVIMPADVRRHPNVAVYIDSSGSMSEKMLARAVAETKGVLNSMGVGAKVRVFSGDTTIHHKQTAYKNSEIRIFGGGGTDVVEGIKLIQQERPLPDLIVAITDGYTNWGSTRPPGDLLIVNVGHGPRPDWPCKYVHIPEDE